ncbi:hypothetical protein [Paraburkholderia acidiphila]|uniref:Uncharacterized protein n=1 Tax=Paraburkholderia acidiphila TaxID=2571747 RepID=A0A7Z2GCN1_9BURK|nr:hypothetical protein [Paraburkholderia acidiphila]QGZ59366.1 hypothetical protein FAZ97_30660 [Paraburkholderia acidiphila]
MNAAASAASSADAAEKSAASATSAALAASSAAASAAQSASAASASLLQTQNEQAPLPTVRIECARVMEQPSLMRRLFTLSQGDRTPPHFKLTKDDCTIAQGSAPDANHLVGAGDVEIFVDGATYAQAVKRQGSPSPMLHLYLNGVDMASDGELISLEATNQQNRLQFHITAGPHSQVLWASIYRTAGLVKPETLRVGLGWDAAGQSSTAPPMGPATPAVSVTNRFSLICAILVIVVLIFIWIYEGYRCDVFRDAKMPDWWTRAIQSRKEVKAQLGIKPVSRKVPAGREQEWLAAANEYLLQGASYQGFNSANINAYQALAADALARKSITDPADQSKAYFGLVLRVENWKPVRATFSLGRMQLGLWFAFAVCAGVFLWIVYGDLPPIDGSLLGLLGISAATTAGSLAVDSNAGGRDYMPTQGLFNDLVTGFNDDKQQIHRLQSVVVNLLLLAVGVVHVVQNLTYPTFDPTWLGFLGISGVTLVVGKQYMES